MPVTTATHEFSHGTAPEFEALLQTAGWEAFDGWISNDLERLESVWRFASSPRAWNETGRRSRQTVNR